MHRTPKQKTEIDQGGKNMKKLTAILLSVLILCSLSTAAYAEGALTYADKNLIELEDDNSAYFFAKIENTGDQPVGVGNGKLVGFSEKDDILVTENYVSSLPSGILLQPGEYAYVCENIYENTLKDADIVDFKASMETDGNPTEVVKIPCEAEFVSDGSYDHDVWVTFTNTTEDVLFDAYITVAMYDTEGTLVCVDGGELDDIGVFPGSTITVKVYIDHDLVEYYAANGIEIGVVDALVYKLAD